MALLGDDTAKIQSTLKMLFESQKREVGFRIQGLGFTIYDLGFRVTVLGFG
jgi:hypothetical protein